LLLGLISFIVLSFYAAALCEINYICKQIAVSSTGDRWPVWHHSQSIKQYIKAVATEPSRWLRYLRLWNSQELMVP